MILKIYNNFYLFFLTLFFFGIFFFSSAMSVHAARLDLLPTTSSVKVGDTFKIRITLSSPNTSANAISGNVSFSNNLLSLTSISKSNSIVSLWPVEPTYSNSSGTASFEGVVLNGYTGSNATILTLSFKAKALGNAQINFSQGGVLANDGSGTSLSTSLGDSQISILASSVNAPVVNTPVVPSKNNEASLQIEEIKKKNELDSRSRFLIISSNKKASIPYKIEVDDKSYVWDDAPDHVFETEQLSRGNHEIKVYMETNGGESISKNLTFSNVGIHTPIFTDFSSVVSENEYIVIKGTSDPLTYVRVDSDFVSSSYDTKRYSATVRANENGLFTYVSPERAELGMYSFVGFAYTEDGTESDKTSPIKISIKSGTESLFRKIVTTLSVLIPLVGLFILLILLILFGWYKVRNYKEILRKRLLLTSALVTEEFKIIEKDLGKENQIIEKAKAMEPLSESELHFVGQFKKDLDKAESLIINDLRDSSK
jgi:hypothetical protein